MLNVEELSLSEKVCYSTLRIEAAIPPNLTSTGTGFLFRFKVDDQLFIPCLVTNKHVIDGSINTSLVITCTLPDGRVSNEKVQVQTSFWKLHPDPDTDLCILPIQPVFQILASQGKQPFFIPLDESLVPSSEQLDNLTAIEDIIMVGYPDGIWDSINNQPIIRRGITATHPKNDFNGKGEFLIDATCFPGSSGSPVLILNQGGYVDKRGNLNWGASRVLLLGIMYAGPQHTAEGGITFTSLPKTYTNIPNNLGLVIKSSRLMDFKPSLLAMVKL